MKFGRYLKLNIEQDFEEKKFGQDCSLVKILRLKFGRDSEAQFVSTCDMTLVSHFVESTLPFGPLCLWRCFILGFSFVMLI